MAEYHPPDIQTRNIAPQVPVQSKGSCPNPTKASYSVFRGHIPTARSPVYFAHSTFWIQAEPQHRPPVLHQELQ